MCGIAGILEKTQMEHTQVYGEMLATMNRRGPDEQQLYQDSQITLLHARLSIVDLEHGKQPMIYHDGVTYVLVYNGELYNTKELKEELISLGHTFQEQSDTEVLLHAFMEWEEDCVEKLNGIFAFAVWIKEAQRLFLARDRMGVKPLYYVHKKGHFLFASEIKTLLVHPVVSHSINRQGILEVMMMGPGRTPGYGVFEDIRELKPGQFAYIEDDDMQIETYDQLKDRIVTDSFLTAKHTVQVLVEDAIERQLQADVDVVTFLSGGLDSSIISAVASEFFKKRGKQLETFSVTYEDNETYFRSTKFQPNSDAHYIDIMQKYLGSKHHTVVLKTEDLVDALYTAVDARDLPGMADVDSSLLLFCKEIRKHAKVALSGECADEIFGGYPWYRDPSIRDAYGFPWAQSNQYRASFLKEDLCSSQEAIAYVDQHYQACIAQTDALACLDKDEKRLREMVNLNMKWFMQTLLDRKDRMSMYQSLEVRVPFCDMRIADYLYSLPWSYKDYKGYEKGLLREAVRGMLPDEVLWRKKSPYPKTWHPKYRELVTEQMRTLLSNCQEPLFDLVRKDKVEQLLQEDRMIPWYGQLMNTPQTIAYLLQVNYWLKKNHITLHV